MKPTGSVAQDYAQRGWAVFPVYEPRKEGGCSCGGRGCCSPGKHPRVRHGLKSASRDPSQVEAWWANWPDANIGIRTGSASKLVVLDVDLRHGGEVSLRELEREIGVLPPTVTVLTGGGGWHLYFEHPGGTISGRTGLRPGIDLKADQGYVIAPPSLHESGNRYIWKTGHGPDDLPLAELPESLLVIASGRTKLGGASRRLDVLAPIFEGDRNTTLTRYAGWYRGQGMEPQEYFPLLEVINQTQCHPPLPTADVERIACSVGRYPPGDNSESVGSFPCTDLGNARRLIRARGSELRYVHNWGTWLYWDDTRWRQDNHGQVERWAKEEVERIRRDARVRRHEQDRQRLLKWANDSESKGKIQAMIDLAKSEKPIAIVSADLFADPWKLPVQNGTLDLRTGELCPHERGNMVTSALDVSYDPAATAPRWEEFLREITGGGPGLSDFLRRCVGYSLTGSVKERCLFLLVGDGANGKSTFLRTLHGLFGPYGTQAEPTLLVAKNWDQHPTGVADLEGKRFVVAVEVNTGKSFDHALVKQLTGGDMIKARRMRQDFFEFEPTHHFWLAMNAVPQIDPDDQAMWDRVKVIPFPVRFDRDRQDRDLLEKLQEEKAGILTWAVKGCLEWQDKGLQEPGEVIRASGTVKAQMDPVGRFLGEECLTGPSLLVEASRLYQAYADWCDKQGETRENQNRFGRIMTKRRFERYRDPSGRFVYRELGLREDLKHPNHSSPCPEKERSYLSNRNRDGSDGSEEDLKPGTTNEVSWDRSLSSWETPNSGGSQNNPGWRAVKTLVEEV